MGKILFKLEEGIPAPTEHLDAMAYDLYVAHDVVIPPRNEYAFKVSNGVAIELPPNFGALVLGRSSTETKTPITVATGLIDNDYRGTISTMVYNLTDKPVELKKGDRISQLLIKRKYSFKSEVVEELSETERGTGGFGSSGK